MPRWLTVSVKSHIISPMYYSNVWQNNEFSMCLRSSEPECDINYNIVISFTLACSSKDSCDLLLFITCFLYR